MRTLGRAALHRGLWRIANAVRGFVAERTGSVAVEYTVIAGLVSTAIVVSLGTIAGPLGQILADLGERLMAN